MFKGKIFKNYLEKFNETHLKIVKAKFLAVTKF